MAQVLDLGNTNNWEDFWDQRVTVEYTQRGTYTRIPEIICPIAIDSHIIAVYTSQQKGSKAWRYAGFMNQRLDAPITKPQVPVLHAINKEKVFLNRWTLFNFPRLTTSYTLSFEPPFWFEDFNVIVLKYTGVNYDSTLDEFDNTNSRILVNTTELAILRGDVEELLNK